MKDDMKRQGFQLLESMAVLCCSTILWMMVSQWIVVVNQHTSTWIKTMQTLQTLAWLKQLMQTPMSLSGLSVCRPLYWLHQTDARRLPRSTASLAWTSQSLVVQYTDIHRQVPLHTREDDQLWIPACSWDTRDSIIIANCFEAEIHDVLDKVPDQGGCLLILDTPLQKASKMQHAYVAPWIRVSFLLRNGHLYYRHYHTDAVFSGLEKAYWEMHHGIMHLHVLVRQHAYTLRWRVLNA